MIDPAAVIAAWQTWLKKLISDADYTKALQVYPNKGLPDQIGQILGLRNYPEHVLRRLQSKEGKPLLQALRQLSPRIP